MRGLRDSLALSARSAFFWTDSNRGSQWANSAVVTSVGATYGDTAIVPLDGVGGHPQLAGLAFQEAMEARAAAMGVASAPPGRSIARRGRRRS